MGIFDFFKGSNQPAPERRTSYSPTLIESFFGGGSIVPEEEALTIPALASGVELISNAIGQLQFTLVKKDEKTGAVTRKNDDQRLYLLNKQPNDQMDAYTYKRALAKDYLLYGASNSVIEKNLNNIKALYLLPTKNISVQVYVYDGYKKYSKTTLQNAVGTRVFSDDQLLTVLKDSDDGLTGRGILKTNPDVLNLALAEIAYSKNLLKNGALPVGVLQSKTKLSNQAFENLKASWEKMYSGTDKAGKTVILEEGLEYNAISLNPDDLQLKDIRAAYISDIARILNIPETMINSSSNKYGSSETQSIAFLQNCLSSIISAIESAVNKELLLENEKMEGYAFRLDASKLIQVTRKEKAEAVAAEYESGLISFWEARSDLDRAKTVSDDFFRLSLGSVLYKYENDEMIIPNTLQSKSNLEAQQKLEEGG